MISEDSDLSSFRNMVRTFEKGMADFERGSKLDKVGQPESETAELFFNDVGVPGANLIGDLNRGFYHMVALLPQERLSCAVSSTVNKAGANRAAPAHAHP